MRVYISKGYSIFFMALPKQLRKFMKLPLGNGFYFSVSVLLAAKKLLGQKAFWDQMRTALGGGCGCGECGGREGCFPRHAHMGDTFLLPFDRFRLMNFALNISICGQVVCDQGARSAAALTLALAINKQLATN